MNRKLISKALSGIDDRFVTEAMDYKKKKQSSPERTTNMGRYENTKGKGRSRRFAALVLAACLVFALAVTAYAANAFGIRDMFRSENRELPEEVVQHIQQHTEKTEEEDIHCQIDESYCDSGKVMVTLSVFGGEDYILAPTDAGPESPASIIGISGEETLESYAQGQGKKLLFVSATLMRNEELGIFTETYNWEHLAPNEMHILVDSTRTGGTVTAGEAVCSVVARDVDGNRKDMDVPFTLTQVEASDSGTFTPDNPNLFPGVTFGDATVTKEASGINIRWKAGTDHTALPDGKINIEEISQYEGGGYVLENDGYWYFELYMGQGEVTDTLTVHFTDWDDNPTGDIIFKRNP